MRLRLYNKSMQILVCKLFATIQQSLYSYQASDGEHLVQIVIF